MRKSPDGIMVQNYTPTNTVLQYNFRIISESNLTIVGHNQLKVGNNHQNSFKTVGLNCLSYDQI